MFTWTLRCVAATQLMRGDLLMHGIGLYMLIEIPACLLIRT
jgi:hypothetical protein